MKVAKLSALSTKHTASILSESRFISLSPCFGLLCLNAPSLIANIRALKGNHAKVDNGFLASTDFGKFVKEIFHQREESNQVAGNTCYKRRYGPLANANSRSLPLYWLNSKGLGQLLGIALLSCYQYDCKMPNKDIDDLLLSSLGVECNHYEGRWTGVSLERYRRVVKHLAYDCQSIFSNRHSDHSHKTHDNCSNDPLLSYFEGYSLPIFQAYVWGKANDKSDLLDFLLGIECTSKLHLISAQYDQLRLPNSEMRKIWCADHYTLDCELADISIDTILNALSIIFKESVKVSVSADCVSFSLREIARPLELVSASVALHMANKPVIKLGRYVCTSTAASTTAGVNHNNASTLTTLDRMIDNSASKNSFIKTQSTMHSQNNSSAAAAAVQAKKLSKDVQSKLNILERNNVNSSSDEKLLRPDCVEVVVREIIDNLIYDKQTGQLCVELLPHTAHPTVIQFYQDLQHGRISDVPNLNLIDSEQINQNNNLYNKIKKRSAVIANHASTTTDSSIYDKRVVQHSHSPQSKQQSKGGTKTRDRQYYDKINNTAGQAWFNLCSNLSGCDYLSSAKTRPSHNNNSIVSEIVYELTPTRLNVLKTLQYLLTSNICNNNNNNNNNSQYTSAADLNHNIDACEKAWTTFKDFEYFCNNSKLLFPVEPITSSNVVASEVSTRVPHISTSDTILLFRAPFSDTEKITREITHITYYKNNLTLIVELEQAHGLASVKYVTADRSKLILENSEIAELMYHVWRQQYLEKITILKANHNHSNDHTNIGCKEPLSIFKKIFLSIYLSDSMISSTFNYLLPSSAHQTTLSSSSSSSILSTRNHTITMTGSESVSASVFNNSMSAAATVTLLHIIMSASLGPERLQQQLLLMTCDKTTATVTSSLSSHAAEMKKIYEMNLYIQLLHLVLFITEHTTNTTVIKSSNNNKQFTAPVKSNSNIALVLWLLSEIPVTTICNSNNNSYAVIADMLHSTTAYSQEEKTMIADCLLNKLTLFSHSSSRSKSNKNTNISYDTLDQLNNKNNKNAFSHSTSNKQKNVSTHQQQQFHANNHPCYIIGLILLGRTCSSVTLLFQETAWKKLNIYDKLYILRHILLNRVKLFFGS